MKNKYREAAERLFYARGDFSNRGKYCCNQLEVVKGNKRKFKKYFYDPTSRYASGINPDSAWFGVTHVHQNQLARELALLFMEQIERDGK